MTILEKRTKRREACRKWRERNPERNREIVKKSMKRHSGDYHGYDALRRYGITHSEYLAMLNAQGGLCAICGLPPKTRRLHIDHDHRTGRVRGILCFRCNTAIGKIERKFSTLRTPEFLLKIREYLLRPIPLGLENEL